MLTQRELAWLSTICFKVKSTIRRKKNVLYIIMKVILNRKTPKFKIILYPRTHLRIQLRQLFGEIKKCTTRVGHFKKSHFL